MALDDGELEAERRYLDRVREFHNEHVDRARNSANRLGQEAVEAAAEGIRDIIDEDSEADTAVRAAEVRQSAIRAMHAANRVRELEGKGTALAFGCFTTRDERAYVGRLSVFDGDETLLIDWRAPAAVPFYRATPLDRHGVRTRRQFHYDSQSLRTSERQARSEDRVDGELVGYSDDVLDPEALTDPAAAANLRGEAAVMAAVLAPTSDGMKPVVAMIQAEQDAVIRAPSDQPLIVQGGPGTGKTVVALHRAAYLLYDQREELSDTGVLIVGPTRRFLRYVSNVLPSLGETGVVSAIPAELFPARRGAVETRVVAGLKGDRRMVKFLATAVNDRRRIPREPLRLYYGSRRVVLRVSVLEKIFDRATRTATHNDGAEAFRSGLIDALVDEVYDPAFFNVDDATATFMEQTEVARFLLAHWPPLTPEQALNDLYGSGGLLASAGRAAGLSAEECTSLSRARTRERLLRQRQWTDADMPLLDELQGILGQRARELSESARARERDVEDEFELAQALDRAQTRLDDNGEVVAAGRVPGTLDLDDQSEEFEAMPFATNEQDEEIVHADPDALPDPGTLVDRFQGDRAAMVGDVDPNELVPDAVDRIENEGATVRDLARGERSFRFGHVIVDEAQDLSFMQWRMVIRRAEPGSLTAVGDLAQRTIGPVEKWADLLPSIGPISEAKLTINYRSPSEVLDPAGAVLNRYAPQLEMPRAIRSSGSASRLMHVEDLSCNVADAIKTLVGQTPAIESGRTLAIIWPSDLESDARRVIDDLAGAAEPIQWGNYALASVSAEQCRGLEFDAAVVVEPNLFGLVAGGEAMLFVALTRATQWSAVISTGDVDAELAATLVRGAGERR